jgi:hypothetical protein
MTCLDAIEPKKFRYSSRIAALFDQSRFALQNLTFLASLAGLTVGGAWLWLPFVFLVCAIGIINARVKLDLSEPENPPHGLHNLLLRATLPLLLANGLLLASYFTASDPLHVVAGLAALGIDLKAARAATGLGDKLLAVVAQGFYWGLAQTVAHELCHRRASRLDTALSRWLGALALDPTLHLHHPFCHHRFLGLMRDPGTARRGEHVYGFALRSTLGNVVFAARAESARLRRRGRGFLSLRNRFLTAWAICLAYAGASAAVAGFAGVTVYLVSAVLARLLFDSTAYVEHYGLFRLEGERVSERLSWDVYFFSSNSVLYNAARHADHHLNPMRHYADLKIRPEAPRLNHAYITLVLMAFLPPLYWRTMQPHLDAWDAAMATPDHLAFLHEKMTRRAQPPGFRRAA